MPDKFLRSRDVGWYGRGRSERRRRERSSAERTLLSVRSDISFGLRPQDDKKSSLRVTKEGSRRAEVMTFR